MSNHWAGFKPAVKVYDYLQGKESKDRWEVDCPNCTTKLVLKITVKPGSDQVDEVAIVESHYDA
jgi:hypothetical protein